MKTPLRHLFPTLSLAGAGFSQVPGESARVLLERDGEAEEEFWKPRGLLTFTAPVPETLTVTWVLGEDHPLLPAAEEEFIEMKGVAEFKEIITRPGKSGDHWRDFGTSLVWSIDAAKGPGFDLQVAREEKGASTAGRAFQSNGSLGKAADPAKFPITTYVEKFDKNGEHSNEGEKQQGQAGAALVRTR